MSSSLSSVDYFFILIFAVSMLAGFMRGLLKEVISLITWIAASSVSTFFASKLAGAFGGASSSQMTSGFVQNAAQGNYTNVVALGISFVVLFIATLFAGYLVNVIVIGVIQGAYISLPNRIMGALFGAIRGFIIVIIVMFLAELTPIGAQPAWAASPFVKSFAPTVKWLQELVQPGMELIRSKTEDAITTIKASAPSAPASSGGFMNGITGGGSTDPYSSSNAGSQ